MDRKTMSDSNNNNVYSKNSETMRKLQLLKYISLTFIVVQNAGQILLTRHAMVRTGMPFLKTVAILLKEVVEAFSSLALLLVSFGSVSKIREKCTLNCVDIIRFGISAICYTMKNFLLYVAIDHLDAGSYAVTYQLNILTAALFTVILLNRRLSGIQWIALVFLVGGVAMIQISADREEKSVNSIKSLSNLTIHSEHSIKTPHKEVHEQNPIIGLLAIISACFLQGFASITFEKVIKESNIPLWLGNVQYCCFSTLIAASSVIIKDRTNVLEHGFFQGFDEIVWAVVLMKALGGMLLTFVIKYADNILRAFSTAVSIILISIVSIVLYGIYPTLLFTGGTIIVMGAIFLYNLFPYRHYNKVVPITAA